jgi:hypothetical protein
MKDGIRIDASLTQNRGRIGGWKMPSADPNEYLIQLEVSAMQLKWSELERRTRAGVGRICEVRLKTLSRDLSQLISTN